MLEGAWCGKATYLTVVCSQTHLRMVMMMIWMMMTMMMILRMMIMLSLMLFTFFTELSAKRASREANSLRSSGSGSPLC